MLQDEHKAQVKDRLHEFKMHAARRAAQRKARDEAIVTVAASTPPPENRKVEAVAGVRSRGATASMRRILPAFSSPRYCGVDSMPKSRARASPTRWA